MTTFIGALTLLLLVTITWRLASRRTSLPCPSWLAWMVELESPLAKSQNADSIVRRLNLQPGMRVLDAGCGPGRVTIPIAKALGVQGEVVAIDIQQQMLDRARAKAQAAGLTSIQFRQAAIEEGKLGENQYDRIVLVTVLGEIPDRKAALREIHRALKPGGFLSVTEMVFDPHYQTRASIEQNVQSVGLRERAFFGNRIAFTVHLERTIADLHC